MASAIGQRQFLNQIYKNQAVQLWNCLQLIQVRNFFSPKFSNHFYFFNCAEIYEPNVETILLDNGLSELTLPTINVFPPSEIDPESARSSMVEIPVSNFMAGSNGHKIIKTSEKKISKFSIEKLFKVDEAKLNFKQTFESWKNYYWWFTQDCTKISTKFIFAYLLFGYINPLILCTLFTVH